jgi:hypothetical protein
MPSIKRRQTPPTYEKYVKYKPFLRADFRNRCCYCGISERDWGGPRHFHIDHFKPWSKPEFAELVAHYPNLYYACDICNNYKRDNWPTPEEEAEGSRFWDACLDLSVEHFTLQRQTGEIASLTRCATYTERVVRINRQKAQEIRLKRLKRAQLYRLLLKEARKKKSQLSMTSDLVQRESVRATLEMNQRVLDFLRPHFRSRDD